MDLSENSFSTKRYPSLDKTRVRAKCHGQAISAPPTMLLRAKASIGLNRSPSPKRLYVQQHAGRSRRPTKGDKL